VFIWFNCAILCFTCDARIAETRYRRSDPIIRLVWWQSSHPLNITTAEASTPRAPSATDEKQSRNEVLVKSILSLAPNNPVILIMTAV